MTDIHEEDLTTAYMLGRHDGRKDAERGLLHLNSNMIMDENKQKSTNIQDGLKFCLQKGQWASDGEYVTLTSNVTRTAFRFRVADLEMLSGRKVDNSPVQ